MTNPDYAFFQLDNRGVLLLEGADAKVFLQGLVSQDVLKVEPNNPEFAALLTPQGKFLYDLFIWQARDEKGNFTDGLWLDIDKSNLAALVQLLQRHKLRSKVTITDISGHCFIMAAVSLTMMDKSSQPLFYEKGSHFFCDNDLKSPANEKLAAFGFVPDPRLPHIGLRAIIFSEEKNRLENDFEIIDYKPAFMLRQLCSRLGVTDGCHDMLPEKSTLQEGNYDFLNAIDWKKGCYMGQELTARIHYRGLVKRRLLPIFCTENDIDLIPETVLYLNGSECGMVRSYSNGVGFALLELEPLKQIMHTELNAQEEGTLQKENTKLLDLVTPTGRVVHCFWPKWLRLPR